MNETVKHPSGERSVWDAIAPRAIPASVDFVLLVVGLALNFWVWLGFLRLGQIPREYVILFANIVLPLSAIKIVLFAWFGLYRSASRRASFHELATIVSVDTIVLALLVVFNISTSRISSLGPFPLADGGEHILRLPWGIVVNDWTMTLILIGGVRFARRADEEYVLRTRVGGWKRVLIVGAEATGEQVARNLSTSTSGRFQPIGFVDADPAKTGLRIRGLPVFGTIETLSKTIEKQHPDEIVIALRKATPRALREVIQHCQNARLQFRIVPALGELMEGRVEVSTLRPVEIEDLLGRDPVDLHGENPPNYLAGKRVLVTGAGGSIGRELCRQALSQKPESIVMLGKGENSIFEVNAALEGPAKEAGAKLQPVVGDVRDAGLIQSVFDNFEPHVVFHAAAHKHVHLMEEQPAEAVRNNVEGTSVVATQAAKSGVERFIFVSSDKAVRPSGIMGATKRVAEMVVGAIGAEADGSFVSVRFGNVLGSRGSVIPTFQKQIERGGPVTVTDPETSRYFMTIPEAVSLLVRAGARGRGGEIFVLDMGQPLKIDDLARNLITISGLEPDVDISIVYTGLRPGEKLTEELLTDEEGLLATEEGKIFVAHNSNPSLEELQPSIDELLDAARSRNEARVRKLLQGLVPGSLKSPSP